MEFILFEYNSTGHGHQRRRDNIPQIIRVHEHADRHNARGEDVPHELVSNTLDLQVLVLAAEVEQREQNLFQD